MKRVIVFVLVGLMALSVVFTMVSAGSTPTAHGATLSAPPPAHYRLRLRRAVRTLPVAAADYTGYQRDKFTLWIDADHDGCDTRYEVLIAEAVKPPAVGPGCYLTGGQWRSYYDRVTTTDPSTFDIDHLVALAEAWASGASSWDASTRTRYANDLGDPRTLVAVTASANRTKSDDDPAHWLPTYGKCRYISDWVAVKLRWHLNVDHTERRALLTWANRCPNRIITVRRARISSTPPSAPTQPAAAGVHIGVVNYDPAGPDTGGNVNGEWVSLVNTAAGPADLTGWTVSDAAGAIYQLPAFTLEPGAAVKIHSGSGTDTATDLYAGWSYTWNNTGDTVTVRAADGAQVDTCTYTSGPGSATC